MHASSPKQHEQQVKRRNREKLPQQKVGRLEEHVNESRQYAGKLEKARRVSSRAQIGS